MNRKPISCQCPCKDGCVTEHESGECYLCRRGFHASPDRERLIKALPRHGR